MANFIKDACAELPEAERERLLALTPATYTGNAAAMAKDILKRIEEA
jgi:hypothetical protein